jgi:chloride channel protein, CIC family
MLGVPISAAAYGFLQLVSSMQTWVFSDIPKALGFNGAPPWWPLLPLALSGLIVAIVILRLPGHGGEIPIMGFKAGSIARGIDLPGIALAAIASIGLGAVVGPEAPLIALGGGLALLLVRAVNRNMPRQGAMIVGATGSFAAVSTLLGSPLVGAFLLMEVSGLGGALASAVLVPGLLAAGVGALIFTGLDALTGEGTFSLAIPNLPDAGRPTIAAFGWALVIGAAAALVCWALRRGGNVVLALARRHTLIVTMCVSLLVAGLAILFAEVADHSYKDVLFSGQDQLPSLLENSASYSVGALLLLVACKGLAYAGSLAVFRGGPTFPAMFIGAAGGVAMSHLPGLGLVQGAGMAIGAMTVGMLRLPMTSALLTTLFLGSQGVNVVPLVIVAVVVSHVLTIRISPPSPDAEPDRDEQEPAASRQETAARPADGR